MVPSVLGSCRDDNLRMLCPRMICFVLVFLVSLFRRLGDKWAGKIQFEEQSSSTSLKSSNSIARNLLYWRMSPISSSMMRAIPTQGSKSQRVFRIIGLRSQARSVVTAQVWCASNSRAYVYGRPFGRLKWIPLAASADRRGQPVYPRCVGRQPS